VSPDTNRDRIKVAIDKLDTQDSTAIGEAIETSLDSIKTFDLGATPKGDKPPAARIVLLSDGASNKGRSPMQAASDAKAASIPVSTIAFGSEDGVVDLPGYGPQPVPPDPQTLQAVAAATGGSFHGADSATKLKSVYADIGKQIGYEKANKIIAWRFFVIGLLFAFAAAGASLLWAGRLA
jgi:Ca-activated chloride channel family protein